MVTCGQVRVSVCLAQFFSDERARARVVVDGRWSRVGSLAGYLRTLFSLRGSFCLTSAGHLLPPAEPTAVFRDGDLVTVVPIHKEWDNWEEEENTKHKEIVASVINDSPDSPVEKHTKRKKKKKNKHDHETAESCREPTTIDNSNENLHVTKDHPKGEEDCSNGSIGNNVPGDDSQVDSRINHTDSHNDETDEVDGAQTELQYKENGMCAAPVDDHRTEPQYKENEMSAASVDEEEVLQQLKRRALALLEVVAGGAGAGGAGVRGGRVTKRPRRRRRRAEPDARARLNPEAGGGIQSGSAAGETSCVLQNAGAGALPGDGARRVSALSLPGLLRRLREFPVMDRVPHPVPGDVLLFKLSDGEGEGSAAVARPLLGRVARVDKDGDVRVAISILDGDAGAGAALVEVEWKSVLEPRLICQ